MASPPDNAAEQVRQQLQQAQHELSECGLEIRKLADALQNVKTAAWQLLRALQDHGALPPEKCEELQGSLDD